MNKDTLISDTLQQLELQLASLRGRLNHTVTQIHDNETESDTEPDEATFLGWAGSYRGVPSGVDCRLIGFVTDSFSHTRPGAAKVDALFVKKAKEMEAAGLTHVAWDSHVDDSEQVLCLGVYVSETDYDYVTIKNVPNTGQGGPRGTLMYRRNGTERREGGWVGGTIFIKPNGDRLTGLFYGDPDSSIRLAWRWET